MRSTPREGGYSLSGTELPRRSRARCRDQLYRSLCQKDAGTVKRAGRESQPDQDSSSILVLSMCKLGEVEEICLYMSVLASDTDGEVLDVIT